VKIAQCNISGNTAVFKKVKKLILFKFIAASVLCFAVFSLLNGFKLDKKTYWQNGDIVFQDSESSQIQAIKLATNSKFSHCRIVFQNETNGQWMVLEAVQPVRMIPIEKWIANGNDKYEVKRLKNYEMVQGDTLDKMYEVGKSFIGKNYDIQFGWGDDKLYCSELVWKIYQRGVGIELGKRKPLKDYNLNSKLVKEQLKLRYGATTPENELMISPQDIWESELLE